MTTLRNLTQVLLGCAAGLTLSGCMSAPPGAARPEPRPLGAAYASPARPGDEAGYPDAPEPEVVPDTLSLDQALALALRSNPGLKAGALEMRATEAGVLQARLAPNPTLKLELEEWDRAGADWDSTEQTVALEQPFQLGGKRRWRTRVAEAKSELAGWTLERRRLDVYTTTSRRFMATAAAQRRLELARSMVELAEETRRAVTERVKAGKEPQLQASKTDGELEVARIAAMQAENDLKVARRRLAAMWGSQTASFDAVSGALDAVPEALPEADAVAALLPRNPDLARWDAELQLRQAALSAAKAERVPNLSAGIGYHQYQEDETEALSVEVALPLPLFDRNQGNVAAAEHRLAQAEAQRRAEETALSAELAATYADLASVHGRVLALRTRVVPAMEAAFEAAREGYRQGKFAFLDMIDAQRGLFEAQDALLDALVDYHTAVSDLQGLTGTDFHELMNSNGEEQR